MTGAPAPPTSPGSPPPGSPVGERDRIVEMDVARGLALLGIFFVNIQAFARPLGEYLAHEPPPGSSLADTTAYYLVKVVCEGKFYPLFSLLFGMGVMAQSWRADAAGRPFAPLFLRKQGILALLGALHAILLWYGDILFIYAVAGLAMLPVRRWKARTLLIVACGLFAFSAMVWAGLMSLGALEDGASRRAASIAVDDRAVESAAALTPDTPAPETPAPRRTAIDILRDAPPEAFFNPESDARMEADTIAFRDGPYSHAVVIRLLDWGAFLMVSALALGWHVIAVFFLGGVLMKRGLFSPGNERLVRRLSIIGVGAGVPIAALGTLAPAVLGFWGAPIEAVAVNLGGPLLALGYLCAVIRLVRSGRWPRLMRALGAAGRMALTIYLLETVISCAVFQHWGLAQFGQWERIPRLAFVVGVYAALVLLATLWLRAFRMGPMEWLWRTGTYLRPQPLLRRGNDAPNPE